MAPSVGVTSLALQSLPHEDTKPLSDLDFTISFSVQVPPIAWPSCPLLASTPAFLAPSSAPPPPASLVSPQVPVVTSLWSSKPIKIPDIKDTKAYLDQHELIQYYPWLPNYSTWRSDSLLITNASNSDASCFWEGLICTAVKDGSLGFLFNNKGTLYHGKGFEMLAVLDQH